MIDIENLIVDKVNRAVKCCFPNVRVDSMFIEQPKSFPYVSVVEADNYTHRPTQDGALEDHAANVMYSISIFANDADKKATAKRIASIVDKVMTGNLFTRNMVTQVPNHDRSIYRIEMRYTAVVAAPIDDGVTKTYQMYRR